MTSFEHTITNLTVENEYPKLVRDRIPEIIREADGREVPTRILDDAEFEEALRKKAIEEATELAEVDSDTHLLEEVADVEEIIDELLRLRGLTREQVRTIQEEKRQKRGGFGQRILMLSNEVK